MIEVNGWNAVALVAALYAGFVLRGYAYALATALRDIRILAEQQKALSLEQVEMKNAITTLSDNDQMIHAIIEHAIVEMVKPTCRKITTAEMDSMLGNNTKPSNG